MRWRDLLWGVRLINNDRLFLALLPQWASWRHTSCCHYRHWIQWGPFELAVPRKDALCKVNS